MTRRINILGLNILFVFRHKWEKKIREDIFDTLFREYRIGLWFKKNKIVGKKNFSTPKKWGDNMVNSYMFGIDLIICKAWVTVDLNGKHL